MVGNGLLDLGEARFSRLSAGQCRQLKDACLQILERTGLRLYDQEALELVRHAGVAVEDGNRVRLPAKLVEWAIRTAPKEVQLYDRNGRPSINVGGSRTYFGQGSDCLQIIDHRSNQRREPLLQDVCDAIRLGDALQHVDFIMSMFLPTDVDKTTADRNQMEVMLNNTTKPIVFVAYDTAGCLDALEMAEAVAGGPQALTERPFVACYINVATSLRQNQEALQKLLLMAERNVPSCYVPGSTAGSLAGDSCRQ